MTTNVLSIKKIYRCDAISSVDDFLSAREVLKLEMFGDEYEEGLRNFDGVISDIERLFPDFNTEELMETFDVERLEHDEEYRYSLVDWLIKLLEERCGVPKSCFNYAIWGCDTPEEVVESYDVDVEDVNCYVLKDAVLLQDLGPEGQLYGVAKNPDECFEESQKLKITESIKGSNAEIFEWLPFLNKDYSDLDKLTSDDLEIAFDSDHKGEIVSKLENPDVWLSAKLRNEAYIVEKAMDEFGLLTNGLNFNDDYDESINLVKERAPKCKYLNYLFLKTLGSYAITCAHNHLKVLDGETLRKFVTVDASAKDALMGRDILFCYLAFILCKEHFSSFLGFYTLKGANTDKGELFNKDSRTQLNDVIYQFKEVSFDEDNKYIPLKNGQPEPKKLAPFFLIRNSSIALINNKIGSISRKTVSDQKRKDKELLSLVNKEKTPIEGLSGNELVEIRATFEESLEQVYNCLESNTEVMYEPFILATTTNKNGQVLRIPVFEDKKSFRHVTPLNQYANREKFPPEMGKFIAYALLNPRASSIAIYSRAVGYTVKDLHNTESFGFDNPDLRHAFAKASEVSEIAMYDESMFTALSNFISKIENLCGEKIDREPMKYNSNGTLGKFVPFLLDKHYVMNNSMIGKKTTSKNPELRIWKDQKGRGYTRGEIENMTENEEEFFNRIYEECVCASGASGIANTTPQHMMGCVDQKAGDVSRFTGGNGSKPFNTEVGLDFTNDTMKVHKKKGKKGDAITGTGVVYANGKYMEALKEALDNFDWNKMELSEDYKNSKLNETKRDSNNIIESNHEGSVGDWTSQDSLVFAYDLLDSGKGDLDERAILEELYEAPYFKDLFDEIEKEEERLGGSTSNTVGWDNVASDEIEHAAKEVYKILQDLKNR